MMHTGAEIAHLRISHLGRGGVLVTHEALEASEERGAELERAELREKLAQKSRPICIVQVRC